MIKLDKDTLFLASSKQSYANSRRFKIFGIQSTLYKKGSGNFILWTTKNNYSSVLKGAQIDHHGKLTWDSFKKTMERLLNYQPSHLRYAIMKEMFRK